MFENDQDIIDSLLHQDDNFKRLYDKYCKIKQTVADAHEGDHPIDDISLEGLKKEKLSMKDQMANMIESYRSMHA
jgi:uncharacterized protein YdcH (DUF465 family)